MIATITIFGHSSALEISDLKSLHMFPKAHHHHRLRRILSHAIHIPMSTSFGKYLDVPLSLISLKLWTMTTYYLNLINFAGKTTLIKYALSSLLI